MEPAPAPLVIYIAKYSTILDDESRFLGNNLKKGDDLQVYVSRTQE